MFYTTHANDPLPASAGLKVLDIVVRDNLAGRSRRLGEKFQPGLGKLEPHYEIVGEVRGRGLLAAVELVVDRRTKVPATRVGKELTDKMGQLGLWGQITMGSAFSSILRIAPPLTTSDEELEKGLANMEKAFRTTRGTKPLYLATTQAKI